MAFKGISESQRSSQPHGEGKGVRLQTEGAAVVKIPEVGVEGLGEFKNQRKSQWLDQRETVMSQNTGLWYFKL